MWNIHVTENYSAIKAVKHALYVDKPCKHASKINQSPNTTCCLLSLVDCGCLRLTSLRGMGSDYSMSMRFPSELIIKMFENELW